ncbi:MAG: hypothetical protein R3E86_05260 [Pseudomonadales bacterium]
MLLVTAGALLGALVLLFAVVLPAEYGYDPLGTGRALGLTELAPRHMDLIAYQSEPYASDRLSIELAPYESIEYKFRLEQGAPLLFSWAASSELVYDLHAEPDGAEAGTAESFEQSRAALRNGLYVAPFSGWHGWFWENRSAASARLELDAAGSFERARLYDSGGYQEHSVR